MKKSNIIYLLRIVVKAFYYLCALVGFYTMLILINPEMTEKIVTAIQQDLTSYRDTFGTSMLKIFSIFFGIILAIYGTASVINKLYIKHS